MILISFINFSLTYQNLNTLSHIFSVKVLKMHQNLNVLFRYTIIIFHLKNGYFIIYIQDQSKSSKILLTTVII